MRRQKKNDNELPPLFVAVYFIALTYSTGAVNLIKTNTQFDDFLS